MKQEHTKPKTRSTHTPPGKDTRAVTSTHDYPRLSRDGLHAVIDPRSAQPKALLLRYQRAVGNRTVQRAIAPTTEVVQRGILEDAVEWVRGLFQTDPEEAVRDLDSGLQHADRALSVAQTAVRDPQRRRQIEQLAGRLRGLQTHTGRMVQVLDTAENIEHVVELAEALNDIPDDIASDPQGAADAFGRVLASAGELGQLLPEGPWTPYFRFLSGMRNFFTDMLHALDPGLRWREEFEMIEREGAGTTERGL